MGEWSAGVAQQSQRWPILPTALSTGSLFCGWLSIPSCPSLPGHLWAQLASHFSSLLLQVFYNNKGYHSMPTYLNALNNAILRANLPKSKGNPAAYGEDLEVFEGRSTSRTALGHGPTSLQSAVSTLGQAG